MLGLDMYETYGDPGVFPQECSRPTIAQRLCRIWGQPETMKMGTIYPPGCKRVRLQSLYERYQTGWKGGA
jgi:hypothetical protein